MAMRTDEYGRPVFDPIVLMDFTHGDKRLQYFSIQPNDVSQLTINSGRGTHWAAYNYGWVLENNLLLASGRGSSLYFQSSGKRFYTNAGLLVNINTSDICVCVFNRALTQEVWVSAEFDSVKTETPGLRKKWRKIRQTMIDDFPKRFILVKDQETMNSIKHKPTFQFRSFADQQSFKKDLLNHALRTGGDVPLVYE